MDQLGRRTLRRAAPADDGRLPGRQRRPGRGRGRPAARRPQRGQGAHGAGPGGRARPPASRAPRAPVLADGAHNPHGVQALIASLNAVERPAPRVLLLTMMRDKDADQMLRLLLPLADAVVCTQASEPRSLTAGEVAAHVRVVGGPRRCSRDRGPPVGVCYGTAPGRRGGVGAHHRLALSARGPSRRARREGDSRWLMAALQAPVSAGSTATDRRPSSRRPERSTSGGGGGTPNGRGTPKPRRARAAGRPLWKRILLALIVVLAVAAVSFLIGYLIGLKLAIVSFALF